MLSFVTPGLLDIRSAITFGVNVKENPKSIGQFGTGLKYAIAGILRLGGSIYIEAVEELGSTRYDFIAVPETIRGKTFHLLHMEISKYPEDESQSVALGFTTELGAHWESWMLYRELRSNTMDENGLVDDGKENITYTSPFTYIAVICPELEEVHANAYNYFLKGEPLWASANLAIYPARDDNAIFYRGIRVATFGNDKKTLCAYNILRTCQLTEDRTLDRYKAEAWIKTDLCELDNKTIAEQILLAPKDTYEADFSFDYVGSSFSDVVRETIRLNQQKRELNASAYRRAKSYYIEDFLPTMLPMTDEQRHYVERHREIFNYHGLRWPWTDVRLADFGAVQGDEDSIVVHGGILFFSQKIYDENKLVLHLLDNRNTGNWTPMQDETDLVRVMSMNMPASDILRAALPKQPAGEETIPF